MHRARWLVVLVALPLFAAACAPPSPAAPESTAVYAEPPAAAPAPITRLSVNEPTPEQLAGGEKPAPTAPAPAAEAPAPPASEPTPAPAAAEASAPASPPPASPPPASPAPASPAKTTP